MFATAVHDQEVSIYYDSDKDRYFPKFGEYDHSAIARGVFRERVNETGWSDLMIETNKDASDDKQSFASGFAEAVLTAHLFAPHFRNVKAHLCADLINCPSPTKLPSQMTDFYSDNINWVREQLVTMDVTQKLGWSMHMFMNQFDGLLAGYNSVKPDKITAVDLWTYMAQYDHFDLGRKLELSKAPEMLVLSKRATTYVRLASGLSDVMIGHNVWGSYGESQRISKRIRLNYQSHHNRARRKSLSSYPMMIHSGDDFVITDDALVITSTAVALTKKVINEAAWSPEGYPSFFRMMVATQISADCRSFETNYDIQRSGGSGISFQIVDLKSFKYNDCVEPNFLGYIDEIPAMIAYGDITNEIQQDLYFAAYDIPYSMEVRFMAGYEELTAQNPRDYSYDEAVRAKILSDQSYNEFSMDAMKKTMRYNQYQTDPLQFNNPIYAVANRADLSDRPRCRGAIDAKVTNVERALHLLWEGQAGPTYDDQPAFKFSDTEVCINEAHEGVPDELKYPWISHYFNFLI